MRVGASFPALSGWWSRRDSRSQHGQAKNIQFYKSKQQFMFGKRKRFLPHKGKKVSMFSLPVCRTAELLPCRGKVRWGRLTGLTTWFSGPDLTG